MKTESYTDGEGQTRYHLVCTVSETYYYDAMMHERYGMGRVVERTPEGRFVDFFRPIKGLKQIGVKHYRWTDNEGVSHDKTLPVYRMANTEKKATKIPNPVPYFQDKDF